MKKAFTLAEVLITLAIIGVVAALTIPVVVHKYQQKALYTQFMKMYNSVQTASQLCYEENGETDWDDNNLEGTMKHYVGDCLKVAAYCSGQPELCGIKNSSGIKIKALNSESEDLDYYNMVSAAWVSFMLDDGSFVSFVGSGMLLFDTNGIKGPNTFGRDMFMFGFDNAKGYGFTPYGSEGEDESSRRRPATLEETKSDCSTENTSMGTTCGARLLLEGKMNY